MLTRFCYELRNYVCTNILLGMCVCRRSLLGVLIKEAIKFHSIEYHTLQPS